MIAQFLLLSTLATQAPSTNMCPIRSTAELLEFRSGDTPALRVIDITAQITSIGNMTSQGYCPIIIEDETGRAELVYRGNDFAPGDVVRFQGVSRLNKALSPWDEPITGSLIEKKQLPAPVSKALNAIDMHRDDLRSIITDGFVVSSFVDELDPRFWIMIIKDGSHTLPIFFLRDQLRDPEIDIGARIRVKGIYHRCINSWRQFQHPAIISDNVDLLTPPSPDPFDVPSLRNHRTLTANEIALFGRRKVTGQVMATWDDRRLMLKVAGNAIYFARLQADQEMPQTEVYITLVGEPDANGFRISFENAIWKPALPIALDEDRAPIDLNAKVFSSKDPACWERITEISQGSLVQLTGTVLPFQVTDNGKTITVNCQEHAISINLSPMPEKIAELTAGTTIRVTGRCLIETDMATSYDIFPQIKGLSVITRAPDDLKILSQPPWWTPSRLFGAIAALLAILFGFAIWNRALNRLAHRRGQELALSEVARASSELRVSERTRLAVELHDTLSQNLTGIALAMRTGELALAEKSLKSCREELKNCLWDLRNDALEEADMTEAIRKTLTPHIGVADLIVQFDQPETPLSENTSYAILRVIRELAVNSIRHGDATEIKVIGEVKPEGIVFSVSDDGKGFDANKIPGMEQGHFGLQGIRDRIKHFNGEMTIESSPSTGTKVTIWLKSK